MAPDAIPPLRLPSRRSAARRWGTALAIVAAILAVCYVGGKLLAERARDRTPAELKALMAREDGEPLDVDTAIAQLNRLDVNERRELFRSPEFNAYAQRLKQDQRVKLVRETMDRGIRQTLERYRKMNKEEKEAFHEEIRKRQSETREHLENLTPEEKKRMREMVRSGEFEQVVERALQAYLKVTSSEERAELAPLYDTALENLKIAKEIR